MEGEYKSYDVAKMNLIGEWDGFGEQDKCFQLPYVIKDANCTKKKPITYSMRRYSGNSLYTENGNVSSKFNL